jgi:hypothetical protein
MSGDSAVCLVTVPFVFGYPRAGASAEVVWNDTVVGAAVALVGLIGMVAPLRMVGLTVVTMLLGFWMVFASAVLHYGPDTGGRPWVGTVSGIALILLGAITAVVTQGWALHAEARRRFAVGWSP